VIGDVLGVPPVYRRRLAAPKRHRPSVACGFLPVLEATVRQVQERVPPPYGRLRRIVDADMPLAESRRLQKAAHACD
jgi:hypothetical protein